MLLRMAMIVLAATVTTVVSSKAHAETVTIEEYIGETIAQSVTDAVQNAADLAVAKEEANAEFAKARRDFYGQLERGILGSPEEQRFAVLLHQKDIYYLSLSVAEGVRAEAKRIKAIDTLSGGHSLDGGIPPFPADDLFEAWVDDVRTRLGAKRQDELLMPPSPARFIQAIAESSDSYNRYRKARDRLEFLRWRASRPLIYAPKATTPEARADTYMQVIVYPAIKGEIAGLPDDQRDKATKNLDSWANELRQAIVSFESQKITPEEIAQGMKVRWHFDDEAIAYFWARLGNGKNLQGNDFIEAAAKALADTTDFEDDRRYGRHFGSNPSVWASQLRALKLQQAPPGKLNLFDVVQAQPIKFPLIKYHEVRDAIANGSLGSEPPLPVFHRLHSSN